MSDLSIYELEDIIWEDFEHSGDHIVPHNTDNQGSEDKHEGDMCKKPRLDVTPIQINEERVSKILNQETNMMEKESWSNMLDGVFVASGDADSAKDMRCVQSGGTELCTDVGINKDSSNAVGRNSYNDLNLFSNDGDYKESSGHLSYGWPDAGYFEDVDTMLSNYDSSFGLGAIGNDDELVWFTSEDQSGGFEETLKMDLKIPCSEPSALTNVSQDCELQESDNKTSSFVSESKDEIEDKDQKEQLKQQNLTEGLKSNDKRISSSDKSDINFTAINHCNQNKNLGHDSVNYIQTGGYLNQLQSASGSMTSGIKSEINASSQVQSTESCSQPLLTGNQNQFHMIENKIELQGDIKGALPELDSLDVPGGSSVSTELDELSLEATAFRQLQQVMLQLDLRTKFCIRDSLYRLARSAEQRHNCGPEGTNKYIGLMDMETDTNPIDRTVAHLLFHRPSDSSNGPTSLPLEPNVKVHGSMTGPVMVTKKPSCEQVENESDDKISSTGKN